jgi:hypothetical protein
MKASPLVSVIASVLAISSVMAAPVAQATSAVAITTQASSTDPLINDISQVLSSCEQTISSCLSIVSEGLSLPLSIITPIIDTLTGSLDGLSDPLASLCEIDPSAAADLSYQVGNTKQQVINFGQAMQYHLASYCNRYYSHVHCQ